MNILSKIHLKYPVILASSSPQRKILLKNILQTEFQVVSHQINEQDFTSDDPFSITTLLAREKVLNVYENYKDHLVISADTLVIFKNKIYGKPCDSDDAFQMLSTLSDQTHTVMTSIALRWPKGFILFSEKTEIQFKPIIEQELKAYINTKEWEGKSGGYAIQMNAKKWIKNLKGEVDNVMGLPTKSLIESLKEIS